MAGATSKTSVKSTATKKAAKTTSVKSSKATKSTTVKSAPEKKTAVKNATQSVPVAAKPKSVAAKPAVKTASKPKTASDVKSKAATASKAKTTPSVKETKQSEAAKKTSKTVKPSKKSDAVKTTPTKKTAESAQVNKKSTVVKTSVSAQEAAVQEQEQNSRAKAKRATKFMTKANAPIIAQLRLQLIQRRNEIISSFWGDLDTATVSSQASGDTADAAMDSVHSEMRSQLAEKESQELTDINNALHKMETGEYGLCEECGLPIAIERLEAKPDAELCLKCQEELEEDSEYDNYSYYRYD